MALHSTLCPSPISLIGFPSAAYTDTILQDQIKGLQEVGMGELVEMSCVTD